ncbi:MAG: phosphopantothenoylcysteine decarboxylase [Phycisphaerae bacterium]|nr:phosphopantothenoylcysteine decarboxylase [Phycisphaerae bacterium]
MTRASSPRPTSSGSSAAASGDLRGYEVLVAVCGGIAAYKTAMVVSALVQRGAAVHVAMTAAAQRFVAPLTFEALTARKAHTSLWDVSEPYDPQHLRLTEAADLVLVAPATANMIAKVAHGLADDLVSTMLLSVACPVLIAPAMNTRMWENPMVAANVRAIRDAGYEIIEPGSGWLACRTVGAGRMAEPNEIIERATARLKASAPKAGTPSPPLP